MTAPTLISTMHRIPSPVFEYTKDPTAILLRDDSQPMLSFCVLDQLRRRSQFCDVELRMKGDVRLQAHKVVLASSSPYFMKQFTSSSSALKKSELTLSDPLLDVNTVELLVSFIYTSVLRITESNAHSICLGARVLQLERVERACCKFMAKNLNQKNCIKSLNFSFEHGYPQLLKKSQAYIAEHITKVAANPAFCSLFPSELSGIFECESLTIPSEEALIDLLITWMKHEPESRQKELHHLISAAKLQGNLETSKKNLLNAINHPPAEDSTAIIQKLREISEKPKKAPVNGSDPIYANTTPMLYAAGGITSSSATSAIEKYDIRNGTWTMGTNMPRKKSHFALVTTGKALYSIGGYDGSKRLSSIDVFNPEGESWSEGPSMCTAKSDFGAVWDGKRSIYLIGGYTTDSQDVAAVEILDTHSWMWRKGPKLQQKRSYVQAAMIDNAIYAVGGAVGSTRLTSVEKLELLNNGEKKHSSSWVYVASLNVARSRPGVAALNGKLYAVGGYNGNEHLSSVECYDPSVN